MYYIKFNELHESLMYYREFDDLYSVLMYLYIIGIVCGVVSE